MAFSGKEASGMIFLGSLRKLWKMIGTYFIGGWNQNEIGVFLDQLFSWRIIRNILLGPKGCSFDVFESFFSKTHTQILPYFTPSLQGRFLEDPEEKAHRKLLNRIPRKNSKSSAQRNYTKSCSWDGETFSPFKKWPIRRKAKPPGKSQNRPRRPKEHGKLGKES